MGTLVQLPIDVAGERVASVTRVVRAGAYVVTISTVLSDPAFGVELHSTYVGHPDSETMSTHLMVAVDLPSPTTVGDVHDAGTLDVLHQPRRCLYDHAMRLQDLLRSLGHHASLHITAQTVASTEGVTS